MPAPAAVRRAAAALAASLALASPVLLAGCGSASAPSPPAGVDELVIPTPTPDPDDFVAAVDNPWLPLLPGSSRTYEDVASGATVTVTVEAGPSVAGVPTTSARTVTSRGERVLAETVDHFAQDREGNVWWLGREGEWAAGEDGAEAGVAMLATPRVGDGYREALAPGVVDVRSQVAALDDEVEVAAGSFERVLVVETTPAAGATVRSAYAEGVGLVARRTVAGTPETELGLVAHDEPQY